MQKVLIITYYWPPAGGPGVQRWLKFVKYLRDFDIDPIVYIPENPNYPILDESLTREVPEDIQVLRRPIFEPYGLASIFSKKKAKRISAGIIQKEEKQSVLEKLMLWIRGNLFIPDARKFWVRPSIEFLSGFIEETKVKTIITTGPPHSVHLIGKGLKAKYDVQWIADFRDPWTSIGYHHKLRLTKLAQSKHQKLERMVLNTADKITVTSGTTKKEFEEISPKPIKVITNGFDGKPKTETLDADFTISHIGSLLTDRNPECLWQVLKELVDENKSFKERLKIQLIGVVGEEVWQSIQKHELEPFVKKYGYVSHDEVLKLQSKSQVLLLLEIDALRTTGIIPGKFFEYLNAKRPILGIGPKDWEVASIVTETKSGLVLTPQATSELKDVLLTWFGAYTSEGLTINSQGIEKYSRKALTDELAKFIRWGLS